MQHIKQSIKRVLTLLLTLATLGGVTYSFFTDSEKSVGNALAAGKIDLKIDNVSYYNGQISPQNSWLLTDLSNQLFFSLSDLKPGDICEDAISLHVLESPAWGCFEITLSETKEQTCIEPEVQAGDITCGDEEGDLQYELEFTFWADDGDNVLEGNEKILLYPTPLAEFENDVLTLVDGTTTNPWTTVLADPLNSSRVYFVGSAWCFGTLELAPVVPGFGINPILDPGVRCLETGASNRTQTDALVGSVSFYAAQAFNNQLFSCSEYERE